MSERRWLIILGVVVVVFAGWWLLRRGKDAGGELGIDDVELQSMVDDFLQERGVELPIGADRANLGDSTGGRATGVATREVMDSGYLFTVLAALPDLESGWYEAWVSEVNESNVASLGVLRQAKGGYMLEVETDSGLSDRERVIVTQEEIDDGVPELVVLEGSY